MNNSYIKKIYSGDNIMSLSDIRYLPRWVVWVIDIIILIVSIFCSFYILNRLNVKSSEAIPTYFKFAIIIVINMVFMYLFKTYAGIIRHSTFIDLLKIFTSNLLTVIALYFFNFFLKIQYKEKIFLNPFLLLYFAISLCLLFIFRLLVKEIYHFTKVLSKNIHKKKILVLGIDEPSIAVARAIMESPNIPFQVVGFLSQRTDFKRANLLGKKIYSRKEILSLSKIDLEIVGVLMVNELLSKSEINDWVNLFLEKNLNIYKAPLVEEFKNTNFGKAIKNLQIEDLLNRKPIHLNNQEISNNHFEKNILITGGAGSIGSEIVRQVAQNNPSLIVILDQAETPLHELELEMLEKHPQLQFHFVLGDISNESTLQFLFEKYHFHIVYHAAAYKHVPLVENNPNEAVKVNIIGTKLVADLASKYNSERFLMISTDKAVNPTNVMGATKRVAELYVQALQNKSGNTTKFITTRFGNVLGSNGSVIPYFKKQIEKGGPVTITHPEIVRYFMTISEACELVLEACTMGKGGEIFVFDMGEPVKILDLARRMIQLSGLEPDLEIKIIFTGLRPGEKLYEELISDDAKNLPTHHEKILISKDKSMVYENINEYIEQLNYLISTNEKIETVSFLKKIVPEFKSKNSFYEVLDK